MFKKILIVYSEKLTEQHLNVVEKIKQIIFELSEHCSTIKVTDIQKNSFKNIDLVITAGGDGTLIRVSHYSEEIPILPINSEPEFSEGALTILKDKELSLIKEILKGNYKTIEMPRIQIKRNNVLLDEYALNEVYIGTEKQFATSRYIIEFKDKKEEQRSSGVLVATSGGSSAWYKSAGGKPFSNKNKLAFLVREPYFGDIYKPSLLRGEILSNESIFFEAKKHEGGIIAIDSNVIHPFNNGDKVELSLSSKPLKVLVPSIFN